MSSIVTFFRHCPSCGRRFEIRLLGRRPVELERDTVPEHEPESKEVPAVQSRVVDSLSRPAYHLLSHESGPLTVRQEEFLFSYRCRHCGHQWSEEKFRTETEHLGPGYKGD